MHLIIIVNLNLINTFEFNNFVKVTLVHLYVVRNSSGYILEMDGTAAETFSALSRRFNFT